VVPILAAGPRAYDPAVRSRRVVVALATAALVAGIACGPASASRKSQPRCCNKSGLPFTGLPLYVPVLASLGAIGAGIYLRRRAREV
jgi:hypothetical protein